MFNISHHFSLNNHVLSLIPRNLENYSVLDCGLGYGEWGLYLRTKFEGNPHITGVEYFEPYFRRQLKLNIYNELWNMNILDFVHLWYRSRNRKFDIILCVELIEHLNKDEGIYLVDKLEKLYNKLLIITTPYKFMKTVGYDDNPLLIHRSGHYLDHFKERGFNVKIIRSLPLPIIFRPFFYIYNRLRNRNPHKKQLIAWKKRG